MIRSTVMLAVLLAAAAGAGLAGYRLAQYRATQGVAAPAVAVAAGPPAAVPAPGTAPAAEPGRRILYYRNPMGLPDTSPTPKKDSMGMDYIAVREGEDQDEGAIVKVSLDRVQRIGVRAEPIERRRLVRPIRAVGTVQFDERRMFVISTRYDGWIEKLLVNATGESIRRGQALMQVYSPDLLVAQQEFLTLHEGGRQAGDAAQQLIEGAMQRLGALGLPAAELARLRQGAQPAHQVTMISPYAGIVIDKPAIEGMRFAAGEVLYKLADASSVWLIAEVFERELGLVHPGQAASAAVSAYPERRFEGRVAFIYPSVNRETRTARVRIELPNADLALKADMYAEVEIAAPLPTGDVLAVPDSAVIDNGTRQIVLIERGQGRYEPRIVKLGAKADGYYEVLDGLEVGESVVVAANFLIDAESNLKAALRSFTNPGAPK
jgi:Cu(I)/Ag(I) efflux system membrane fusion protein